MPLIVSKSKKVKKHFSSIIIEVQKANPYRDGSTGRFATGGAGSGGKIQVTDVQTTPIKADGGLYGTIVEANRVTGTLTTEKGEVLNASYEAKSYVDGVFVGTLEVKNANHKLVGSLVVSDKESLGNAKVVFAGVLPPYRRQGVATAMLGFARQNSAGRLIEHDNSQNLTDDGKAWSSVVKANPYRDGATGRFTTGGAGGGGVSETKVLEGLGFTDGDKHTDIIYSAFYVHEGEEINANGIEYYTSTGYRDINNFLRKGELEGTKFKRDITEESINALDSEISRNVAPKDMVLFRGVSGSDASKTFDKLKEGDTFIDKGFVSTTPDVEMVQEFMSSASGQKFDSRPIEKGYVLQVHVPEGQNVFSVHRYFENSGRDSDGMFERENEHILPRGTTFKVNSISNIQVRGKLVDKLIDVTVVSK